MLNAYIDVDECEEDFVTCVANSQCVDTEGSYTCTCYPEYTGNGFIDCQLQSSKIVLRMH